MQLSNSLVGQILENGLQIFVYKYFRTITSAANRNEFSAAQYCVGLVAKHDHENYVSTLLLGKEIRRQAFALRAFNVEVSRCASNVSEETIAKMRLKFWHDSIDKCYENSHSYVVDQPVLSELSHAVRLLPLTKRYLKRMVVARDRAINRPFETLHQLEDYADQTCSSILHILIELAGIHDINVDHASSHLGKAQGIVLLLRSIVHLGRRQQIIAIPHEVLIRHGVSQEQILRSEPKDKSVEECVFEVASAANQHLELAKQLKSQVPKDARKIFLPAVATGRYLERLRKADFRLNHPSCTERDYMLPIALYLNKFRGTY